jgi:hypothetical protein
MRPQRFGDSRLGEGVLADARELAADLLAAADEVEALAD